MRFSWVKNELAAHPCQWNSQLFRDNHQAAIRGASCCHGLLSSCQSAAAKDRQLLKNGTERAWQMLPSRTLPFPTGRVLSGHCPLSKITLIWQLLHTDGALKWIALEKTLLKNFCMATQLYSSLRKKKADKGCEPWNMKSIQATSIISQ